MGQPKWHATTWCRSPDKAAGAFCNDVQGGHLFAASWTDGQDVNDMQGQANTFRAMDAARDFVMGELVADEIAGALMNDGDCPPELWREWQKRIRGAVEGKVAR